MRGWWIDSIEELVNESGAASEILRSNCSDSKYTGVFRVCNNTSREEEEVGNENIP